MRSVEETGGSLPRSGRRTRIRGDGSAPAALLLLATLAAAACIPTRTPSVPPPPEPFVRYPYLQAVTDSSAHLLWTTRTDVRDTLVYWIEGRDDTLRTALTGSSTRHRARLSPLPPDSRVGYRLITGPPRRVTQDHAFRTAPRRGESGSFTALVFGDSGTGSDAQIELARRMTEMQGPDLILHTGDIAYPEGSALDLTERHFQVYRELLARVPFFPTVGNHDVRTDRGLPFARAFVLPGSPEDDEAGPSAAGGGGYHYSFDWGRVHFVGLDSTGEEDADVESDLRRRGRQYEWLAADLAAAAADPRTDWIVAFFHHPPYSAAFGFSGHASDEGLRRIVGPLFDRYGVDLVLTGHDHHYERTHPIRDGEVDRETPGTVYVVTGGGGGRLEWRGVGEGWFTAVSELRHHYVALRVEDGAMVLEAMDRDGELVDRHRVRRVPPAGAAGALR